MAKGRLIGLCAALASAAVLAGCSEKEVQMGEPVTGEESPEEEYPREENPKEENPREENPREENPGEESSGEPEEEKAASSYPEIIKFPGDKRIDMVMYSEGCYCIFDGSCYGFITEEGEEIAPYIYEQAAPFSEGLACVYLDGKYGYIGKDGETKIPFIYDQASSFTDGLAYFRMGEDYGFIDHKGDVVLRPDCDSVSSFQEGRAYFSIDGLYGYLDKTGKTTVGSVYEDAGYFRDGLAPVMRNGGYGVIGIEGEEILSPEYDYVIIGDDFITAGKDGLEYCFDRDGRKCLEEGWSSINVWKGVFSVTQNGKMGLIDRDGNILLEPEYDSVVPIPEKELVIVKNNGSYGVTDYAGREIIPFVYSWISYDGSGAGGLKVEVHEGEQEDQYHRSFGYFGFTEEDSFEEIPPVYDYMSSFQEERAVVGIREKYGIIRTDGSLEYPIEYDRIKLFVNGSAALWREGVAELIDGSGKVIHSGEYVDITLCGSGYKVQKGRKYGFLNEQGEQVIPTVYDHFSSYGVCGADNVFSMAEYGQDGSEVLLKTDKEGGTALPEVFLQNHITPRAKEYMELLQNDGALNLSEIDQPCRNFSKLYRMGEELLLYFCAEPYEETGFPLSSSGFFVFRDGKMEQLAAGYECGGSSRGDYICFWYDKKKSRMKLGMSGAWGGFGGFASGGYVYELKDEGAEQSASWSSVSQTGRNYDQEELLENAELFYDDHGSPYTKESISEAEYVTEYEVDGKRTTKECFEEICGRYRYMDALDH